LHHKNIVYHILYSNKTHIYITNISGYIIQYVELYTDILYTEM